jgi:hypothetical protein
MPNKQKTVSAKGESDSNYKYINLNRKTSAKKRREQMAKDFKEAAKNSPF